MIAYMAFVVEDYLSLAWGLTETRAGTASSCKPQGRGDEVGVLWRW